MIVWKLSSKPKLLFFKMMKSEDRKNLNPFSGERVEEGRKGGRKEGMKEGQRKTGVSVIFIQGSHTEQFDFMWDGSLKRRKEGGKEGGREGRKEGSKEKKNERRKGGRTDGSKEGGKKREKEGRKETGRE